MSIEIKLPLVYRIWHSVSLYYILIPYQFDYMCTKPDPTFWIQSSLVQLGHLSLPVSLSPFLSHFIDSNFLIFTY